MVCEQILIHEIQKFTYVAMFYIFFSSYLVDCFKALLSKGLGLAIILGSILVKVPQILKIVNNRSAEGINLFAVFLEIVVITLNLSYSFVKGFPFTAWGKCEAHVGALKNENSYSFCRICQFI